MIGAVTLMACLWGIASHWVFHEGKRRGGWLGEVLMFGGVCLFIGTWLIAGVALHLAFPDVVPGILVIP